MKDSNYVWTFEPRVIIGKDINGERFSIPIIFQDGPSYVNDMKKRLANLRAISQWEALVLYLRAFVIGIEALEYYFSEKEGIDLSSKDTARLLKLIEVREKKARDAELEEIYEGLGPEKFIEWCKENDYDYSKFLAEYVTSSRIDKTTRIKKWLYNYLADGNEHHAKNVIRPLMVSQRVIENTNEDWQLVRVVASREKFTRSNTRGCWVWIRVRI